MLPHARLHLHAVVDTPLRLPDYAGSTLRGAFGGALRRIACMTRTPTCTGCPLLRTCPYAVVFESAPPAEGHSLQKFSEIPRPYVIEPPAWGAREWLPGETLDFTMVLLGRAIEQTPLILLAWQRALAQGIGPGDGRAQLLHVTQECTTGEHLVFDAAERSIQAPQPEPIPPSAPPVTATLHFHTPLRLQANGHALGAERVDARRLILALARRISLLGEFHGHGAPGFDFAALTSDAEALIETRHLSWLDWSRRSSRQRRTMALGGLVGEWTLNGDLTRIWPLLQFGQITHVGKEAVFGLGAYRLSASAQKDAALDHSDRKDIEYHGHPSIRSSNI